MKMVMQRKVENLSVLNFKNFLVDSIFTKLRNNEKVIFCGDFNIDLYNPARIFQVDRFKELLAGHGFFPIINKPTHLNQNDITKSSLIDHVWSNFLEGSDRLSGIIDFPLSDHLPVFLCGIALHCDNKILA